MEKEAAVLERFIVLAYPRSGSSLICMALKAHPAIAMYNELFHPVVDFRTKEAISPELNALPLADSYHEGADPVVFLERHLYGRAFPPEKKTIGFKLFHQHLRGEPQERLFNWLAGQRDIRVIHLYRKRLLEEYVSLEVAKVTNQWGIEAASGTQATDPPRLTVEVDRFKAYADEVLGYRDQVPALFGEHPLLTIEYHEDVQGRFDATIQRIEVFLQIDLLPLPRMLLKQARQPVSEEITNFQKLHDALKGTKYEALL